MLMKDFRKILITKGLVLWHSRSRNLLQIKVPN